NSSLQPHQVIYGQAVQPFADRSTASPLSLGSSDNVPRSFELIR
ncbi:unnamed protein product, partial [Pieris macdunnoughi]